MTQMLKFAEKSIKIAIIEDADTFIRECAWKELDGDFQRNMESSNKTNGNLRIEEYKIWNQKFIRYN